jgi:hypothetical protein
MPSESSPELQKAIQLTLTTLFYIFTPQTPLRKKRVNIQSAQEKNKLSNSISQSKMNTEPKVVSTQTTISSTAITNEMKPQQVQAQTPDHKMYVAGMRKELAEVSTATPTWSPEHNGHLMVRFSLGAVGLKWFWGDLNVGK